MEKHNHITHKLIHGNYFQFRNRNIKALANIICITDCDTIARRTHAYKQMKHLINHV